MKIDVTVVLNYFGFEGGMWDLIVLIPDHCLSIYFKGISNKWQHGRTV